jgi:hypothetical protein
MLPLLFVAAIAFGIAAAFVTDAQIKRIFVICCVVCAVIFLLLIVLAVAGVSLPLALHGNLG